MILAIVLAALLAATPATPPVADASPAPPAKGPMLADPGFEAPLKSGGWRTFQHAGKRAYEMVRDDSVAAEGEHSFRMTRLHKQYFGMLGQRLPASEVIGETMHVGALLRTRGVGKGGWQLSVTFYGASARIVAYERSVPMKGDTDWQRVVLQHQVPEGTREVEVSVILLDEGTGWMDDVRIAFGAERPSDWSAGPTTSEVEAGEEGAAGGDTESSDASTGEQTTPPDPSDA